MGVAIGREREGELLIRSDRELFDGGFERTAEG